MANTYTQIYIQLVFSVKGRENLIHDSWKNKLYKYITGIIKNNSQKLFAINGVADHIHILLSIKPNIALSDLVRDIKANSSKFINEQKWVKGKFQWQEGFGAFSYSHSQIQQVINYIHNQEKHHANKTFIEEYAEFLGKFNIDYAKKYVID